MTDEQRVQIAPLEPWMRGTKYRPRPAPVFPKGVPTADDLELALALFDALDADSQQWYGAALATRLRRELNAMRNTQLTADR